MTEEELHASSDRGRRADALLQNPLLTEALDTIESECAHLWRDAKTTEAREALWMRLKAAERIRLVLTEVVRNGDISRRKLDNLITGKRTVF